MNLIDYKNCIRCYKKELKKMDDLFKIKCKPNTQKDLIE
jgi:hypothetical protein